MNKIKRSALLAGTVAVMSAVLLCGCGILPEEEELPDKPILNDSYTPDYETWTVKRATIDTSAVERATYRSAESTELSFGCAGVLYELYVQKGDYISEGQLLASYDCTQLSAQLEQYTAQVQSYELQMRQLNEQKELALQKIDLEISGKKDELASADSAGQAEIKLELQTLQTQRSSTVEQYAAKIQTIEDELTIINLKIDLKEQEIASSQIYSPMNGIVTKIENVAVGDMLDAKKTVFTVDSAAKGVFTSGEAVFEVGKTYHAETNSGVEFTVKGVESEAGETFTDTLELLTEGIRVAGGTLITVDVPGVVRENALYIREEALHGQDGGYYVYVLKNNKTVMREVEIGVAFGVVVEITDGLEEGEQVVM